MTTTTTALRPYQEKALNTLDGVIKIADNEMLIQGDYVTAEIVNPELAKKGAVCGGRKACLVGSTYLAHGVKVWREDGGLFETWRRDDFMRTRPALRLAYEALNEAALRLIKREHRDVIAEWSYDGIGLSEPSQGWGEYFFERVLENESHNTIREQVTRVARSAKRLIRSGVVA